MIYKLKFTYLKGNQRVQGVEEIESNSLEEARTKLLSKYKRNQLIKGLEEIK
jgi:hypothetical protein